MIDPLDNAAMADAMVSTLPTPEKISQGVIACIDALQEKINAGFSPAFTAQTGETGIVFP